MNYNFGNKNIICIGDIHGQFSTLRYNINNYIYKYNLDNTVFIVCGDCGFFGTNNDYLWIHENEKVHDILTKTNNELYFFRGNHDDPKLFELPEYISRGSNRIGVLLDYDTIDSDIYGRILIVPGAFSIDRGCRVTGLSYWPNELTLKLSDEDIISLGKFDLILSHSLPSFPKLSENIIMYERFKSIDIKGGYCNFDEIMKSEDEYLVKLHSYLSPKLWISGHYHTNKRLSLPMSSNNGEIFAIDVHEFVEPDKKI